MIFSYKIMSMENKHNYLFKSYFSTKTPIIKYVNNNKRKNTIINILLCHQNFV